MTRKERYRTDAAYREKVKLWNRKSYDKAMENERKVAIHRLRARVNNARVSLEHHEERVLYFTNRILRDQRALNKLLNASVAPPQTS